MQLIAQGLNVAEMERAESLLTEGDAGEVRLYLSQEPTQQQLQSLQDGLLERGVILTEPIAYDARILSIRFVKGIAPLIVIGLVVGGIGTLLAGITGWQVFRMTRAGIPLWVIGVGGAALLYLLVLRPAKEPVKRAAKAAAPVVIKAGKVYVGKKVGK